MRNIFSPIQDIDWILTQLICAECLAILRKLRKRRGAACGLTKPKPDVGARIGFCHSNQLWAGVTGVFVPNKT